MRKPLVIVAVLIGMLALATVASARGVDFGAELSPDEEVTEPTGDTSDAEGEVSFEFKGRSVDFELSWSGLTSPTVAAHIHCGVSGVNGPVGVTLFMGARGTEGEVQGTFTSPDAGNACGWKSLGEVVGAVNSGRAYVNVHTTANTGGEIRGQLG